MATENFGTLHIFGFGDVQCKKTKKSEDLKTLQAVIDDVWDNRPKDYTGTKEYHAINIFDGMFCDWQAKVKGEKGYRVKYDLLDSVSIQALIDELSA